MHERPATDRGRIGLALSGGGFRATLFHLGVIEYLRACDRLKDVKVITAVSGGAIAAAHLGANWERYIGERAEFLEARSELLSFIMKGVRDRVLFRFLKPATLQLARVYGSELFGTNLAGEGGNRSGRPLSALGGNRPLIRLLTTNLTLANVSYFDRAGFHYEREGAPSHVPGDLVPIGIAVAASSAFPPVFSSLKVTNSLFIDAIIGGLQPEAHYLTDAGVFDNLGVYQLLRAPLLDEWDELLISDASATIDENHRSFRSRISLILRMISIFQSRAHSLQLADALDRGAKYIRISDFDTDPHARDRQVQAQIGRLRTDLDGFSADEVYSVLQHGYRIARQVTKCGGDAQPNQVVGQRALEANALLALLRKGRKRRFSKWVILAISALLTVGAAVAAAGYWIVRRSSRVEVHKEALGDEGFHDLQEGVLAPGSYEVAQEAGGQAELSIDEGGHRSGWRRLRVVSSHDVGVRIDRSGAKVRAWRTSKAWKHERLAPGSSHVLYFGDGLAGLKYELYNYPSGSDDNKSGAAISAIWYMRDGTHGRSLEVPAGAKTVLESDVKGGWLEIAAPEGSKEPSQSFCYREIPPISEIWSAQVRGGEKTILLQRDIYAELEGFEFLLKSVISEKQNGGGGFCGAVGVSLDYRFKNTQNGCFRSLAWLNVGTLPRLLCDEEGNKYMASISNANTEASTVEISLRRVNYEDSGACQPLRPLESRCKELR